MYQQARISLAYLNSTFNYICTIHIEYIIVCYTSYSRDFMFFVLRDLLTRPKGRRLTMYQYFPLLVKYKYMIV